MAEGILRARYRDSLSQPSPAHAGQGLPPRDRPGRHLGRLPEGPPHPRARDQQPLPAVRPQPEHGRRVRDDERGEDRAADRVPRRGAAIARAAAGRPAPLRRGCRVARLPCRRHVRAFGCMLRPSSGRVLVFRRESEGFCHAATNSLVCGSRVPHGHERLGSARVPDGAGRYGDGQRGARGPGGAGRRRQPRHQRTPTRRRRTSEGYYHIQFVRPGRYEISVTMTGFIPFKATGVEVATNQVVRTNVKLQVGALTESVTRRGEGAGAGHRPAHGLGDDRRARRSSSCRSTAATSGTWRPRRPASWAGSTATSA